MGEGEGAGRVGGGKENRPEDVASARPRSGRLGGGSMWVLLLLPVVTASSARPPRASVPRAIPSKPRVCGAARSLPILDSDSDGTGIGILGEDPEVRGIPIWHVRVPVWRAGMLSRSLVNQPMPSPVVRA